MSQRFGETDLHLTAPLGTHTDMISEITIVDSEREAMVRANNLCTRKKDYVVYKLVEVARVVLDSPRVVRSE